MTERQEAGRLTIAKHGNDYCVGADGVGLLSMQMTRAEAISYRAGWRRHPSAEFAKLLARTLLLPDMLRSSWLPCASCFDPAIAMGC
jgi:hypothetical protein